MEELKEINDDDKDVEMKDDSNEELIEAQSLSSSDIILNQDDFEEDISSLTL